MAAKTSHLKHLALLAMWMVVIAVLSGPAGSEESMRDGISWLLRPLSAVLGGPPAGEAISGEAVWVLRKLLHMGEYGILALVAFRWFASLGLGASGRAVSGAFALSATYSALDELHQTLTPGRTGAAGDVLIDLLAVCIVLAVTAAERGRPGESLSRGFDLIAAAVGLVLAAPLMLAAAAAVLLNMGRPVLFPQRRVGWYDRPFTLIKFRTMSPRHDANGRALTATERLTPTGRLLRQFSIDELPQLWNVLRGEMSLVGPRPLYLEYLPYYTPRERKRHLVRPGLTGLAQVMGRNTARWDDRLELDVRYVESKSLLLDLRILLRTVGKVIARSDVLDDAIEGSLAKHRAHLSQDPHAAGR
jgi:lipopolysaccharide/colanic/teichoic acid biosynthesis glycosyltransferase